MPSSDEPFQKALRQQPGAVTAVWSVAQTLNQGPGSESEKYGKHRVLIEKYCSRLLKLDKIGIPSGNQTWRAGKWTIEISDFPIKASIYSGFYVAMFDYQRVLHINCNSELKPVDFLRPHPTRPSYPTLAAVSEAQATNIGRHRWRNLIQGFTVMGSCSTEDMELGIPSGND